MNASSRHLRVRLLVPGLALLAVSLAWPAAAVAANPLSGNCNVLQINNNSWLTSTADSTRDQGWITSVSARISVYNYALCNASIIAPNVSSSAAWVAIEGLPTSGNNIVQDGYIKCQMGCVNGFDYEVLDYFWAAGQDGDIFHLPFPVKIGVADTSKSHTFEKGAQDGQRVVPMAVPDRRRDPCDHGRRLAKVEPQSDRDWQRGLELRGSTRMPDGIRDGPRKPTEVRSGDLA